MLRKISEKHGIPQRVLGVFSNMTAFTENITRLKNLSYVIGVIVVSVKFMCVLNVSKTNAMLKFIFTAFSF